MYPSTTAHSDHPMQAWRQHSHPGAIWFGHPGLTVTSLSPVEAQQLIAELQRELASIEAEAQGAAA